MTFDKQNLDLRMPENQYKELVDIIKSVENKVEELSKTVQSLVVWAAGDDTIKTQGVERKLQENACKIEKLDKKIGDVNDKTNKILYVFLGIYIITMLLAGIFGIDLSHDCPYPEQ